MKIIEIANQKFDELSKNNNYTSFYQTSSWAKLKEFTGWKHLFLAYEDESAFTLVLLKKMPLINYYLAYCPRGYLLDYNNLNLLTNFHHDLSDYLKKKHVFEIIIDPYVEYTKRDIDGNLINKDENRNDLLDVLLRQGYQHRGLNVGYDNLQTRWMFRLDMEGKTIEEIEKAFSTQAKRKIKKKELYAINSREVSEEEIDIFKNLMSSTAKRRGFIDRPLSYYKQMYASLHDEGILHYMIAEINIDKCINNLSNEINKIQKNIDRLSNDKEKNQAQINNDELALKSYQESLEEVKNLKTTTKQNVVPMSCVCFMTYGKEAVMLLAGNNADYLQKFSISYILEDDLICLAKSSGYRYYNFYGISGNFDKNDKDYGLYAYKRQFNGEVVELIGEFYYTINKAIKLLYTFLRKVYSLSKKIALK